MKQAPFSFFPFLYQLWGWCIFYFVSTFLIFLWIFVISSNLQLIIPKVYFNTRTTNVPVAVILFLVCKSKFSNILNIPNYSFFKFSLICYYYMPWFSSFPRYFHVFPCTLSLSWGPVVSRPLRLSLFPKVLFLLSPVWHHYSLILISIFIILLVLLFWFHLQNLWDSPFFVHSKDVLFYSVINVCSLIQFSVSVYLFHVPVYVGV